MQGPKVSVVIPYYESDPGKKAVLSRCVNSLRGHDELILVWNDNMGFTRAVNKGYELTRGDFIIMCSDDIELIKGSLRDLCDPNAVTSPVMNGKKQDFWGALWCMPRKIYKELGTCLDPRYANGIYYEDTDLWEELKARNIKHYCVDGVEISHPEGGRTLQRDPAKEMKAKINRDAFMSKWNKVPQ